MSQQTKYKIEVMQYNTTRKISSACNAITFYNNGTITVLVQTIPLVVGATLTIEGNANEIDLTEYQIDFGTNTNGVLTVIRKYNFN